MDDAKSKAAARPLRVHWQSGIKLEAPPDAVRPTRRTEGYAVQACLPDVSGRHVVGWKIAATSAAWQAHIAVDGPIAGRLLSGQVDEDGATESLAGNGMRVVEPEFAFRICRPLAPRAARYTVPEDLSAAATLHPALEMPDSHVYSGGWRCALQRTRQHEPTSGEKGPALVGGEGGSTG